MMVEIILSLVAATCYGIAASIQKYSMKTMKKFSVRKLIKNKNWLLSILVTFIGVVAQLFALKNLPLSTFQPFFGITLMIPVVVGALVFREKLKVIEWTAVLMIVAGILLVLVY